MLFNGEPNFLDNGFQIALNSIKEIVETDSKNFEKCNDRFELINNKLDYLIEKNLNLTKLFEENKDNEEINISQKILNNLENEIKTLFEIFGNQEELFRNDKSIDKINNILNLIESYIEKLEDILKNPLKNFIIENLWEYLDIDKNYTAAVIENLDHNNLIKIKNRLKDLIYTILNFPEENHSFLKKIKEIYSIKLNELNEIKFKLNNILNLINSAINLINFINKKNEKIITKIFLNLLINLKNYYYKIDISIENESINEIVQKIENLIDNTNKLSEYFNNVDSNGFYNLIFEEIENFFPEEKKHINNHLIELNETINLLINLKQQYSEIIEIKENNYNKIDKYNKAKLIETINEYINEFNNKINNYINNYKENLIEDSFEKIKKYIFKEIDLPDSLINIIDLLYKEYVYKKIYELILIVKNIKSIIEKYFKDNQKSFLNEINDFIKNLEKDIKIEESTNSNIIKNILLNYINYLLKINEIIYTFLDCIKSIEQSGDIDITSFEEKIGITLFNVLKSINKNTKLIIRIPNK